MGASSQLRDRLSAEAASAGMDGERVFFVKGGQFLELEPEAHNDADEYAAEDTAVAGAGESPPSPCFSADSSVVDEAVEMPYSEIYPTKHSDENDGDLSSSASTEPLGLSYDDSDSNRDSSVDRSGFDNSFDDEVSEGSFSLPCVRILDFSEIADEIGGGAFEGHHEGVEIEFSPCYFSDASSEVEDESQDGEEEEESLNYSDVSDTDTLASALVGSALELDSDENDNEQTNKQTSEAQDFSQIVRASLREATPAPPSPVSVCASFCDDPEQRVLLCFDERNVSRRLTMTISLASPLDRSTSATSGGPRPSGTSF